MSYFKAEWVYLNLPDTDLIFELILCLGVNGLIRYIISAIYGSSSP